MDHVKQRMADHIGQDPTAPAVLLTPLNAILASVLIYIFYAFFLRTPPPSTLPRVPPPVVFRTYNPHTLLPFNGEEGKPIYFAVRGRVFDVSRGRNFYGPGGPYSNFAGRDASRGLAKSSFDEDMLTKDLDGPLDALEGLSADEVETLQGWEERFNEKYDVVGKLVSLEEYNKQS